MIKGMPYPYTVTFKPPPKEKPWNETHAGYSTSAAGPSKDPHAPKRVPQRVPAGSAKREADAIRAEIAKRNRTPFLPPPVEEAYEAPAPHVENARRMTTHQLHRKDDISDAQVKMLEGEVGIVRLLPISPTLQVRTNFETKLTEQSNQAIFSTNMGRGY